MKIKNKLKILGMIKLYKQLGGCFWCAVWHRKDKIGTGIRKTYKNVKMARFCQFDTGIKNAEVML